MGVIQSYTQPYLRAASSCSHASRGGRPRSSPRPARATSSVRRYSGGSRGSDSASNASSGEGLTTDNT